MSSLLTTVGLNKVSLIKPAASVLAATKLPLNTFKLNKTSLNQRCLFSNQPSLLEESKCKNGECKKKAGKRLTKKKAAFDPSKVDYLNQEGFVHSVESMGSLEGPGNRFLLFVTGCPARCIYCENPDTWQNVNGKKMKVSELVKRARNLKPYYENSVGVVVSLALVVIHYLNQNLFLHSSMLCKKMLVFILVLKLLVKVLNTLGILFYHILI